MSIKYALKTSVTLILIFFLLNLVHYQSDQNAPPLEPPSSARELLLFLLLQMKLPAAMKTWKVVFWEKGEKWYKFDYL